MRDPLKIQQNLLDDGRLRVKSMFFFEFPDFLLVRLLAVTAFYCLLIKTSIASSMNLSDDCLV